MEQKASTTYDGVEKWAEWLDSQPKATPLTALQTNAFIAMSLKEESVNSDPEALSILEKGKLNGASIFYNRVKDLHTYKISFALALFMGCFIDRPGIAVIYSNYLQYKAYMMGKKKLGMKEISLIFQFGFFSEETLGEAWDRQKLPDFSNMLDCVDAQKSIEIKP